MLQLLFRSRNVPGQSLLIVALFSVLIFLIVGFGLDGAMLFMQRRLMQNTADAACLAASNSLALNKINSGSTLSDTATAAAQVVVQNNLGATPGAGVNAPGTLAYSNVSETYTPASGSGAGLERGIEISGSDVRVALQSPANTFFMRVVGYNTYRVAARTHCDAKAGGGGTPFAVARWRGYNTSDDVDTDGLTTDKTLPQYYTQGSHSKVMTVRDLLAEESNSIICKPPALTSSDCPNWPGWGAIDYPGDPAGGTGLYSSPTYPASESVPGRETYIAGNEARPNVGDNSFTGPVVLDYRQTTFPSPLFYNGLAPSTALNQYKDFATKYILGAYPGPFVTPGQELAYYNGVSAGQMIKPFDQRYNKDQIVSVLIYNGTINADPDFSVTFPTPAGKSDDRAAGTFTSGSATCSVPAGEAFDGQTVSQTSRKPDATYTINVLPQNYSNFKLRAFISADDTNKWEGSWNSGSHLGFNINGAAPTVSINTSGSDLTFSARPTRKFSCTDLLTGVTEQYPSRVNRARTLYLEVQDTATGKRRAVYAFLDQDADPNDFYAYFSAIPIAYQPLEPGNTTSAELKLAKAGNGSSLDIGSGASRVQVGTIEWYAPGDLSSALATGTTYNGVSLDVSKQGPRNLLSIAASSGAATGKEYYIRIPLTYGSFTQYAWYYIAIRPPLSNASGIGQFVYALGYANFKITEIGANYIKGRAVSGLLRTQSDIIAGFQPRLLPWQ